MGSVNAKSGGVWGAATPFGRVSGTWSPVQTIYEKIGGVWTEIWSAISASASPASVSGHTPTSGTVNTNATTCTVSGGTSPYSYGWKYVSGDASITATSPTMASTLFTGSVTPGQIKVATYACTVTDHNGIEVTSNPVTARLISDT